MRKASNSFELEAFSFRENIFLIREIVQLFIIIGFIVISYRYYQHVKRSARPFDPAFNGNICVFQLLNFRRSPATPTRPKQRSSMVIGSGTVVVDRTNQFPTVGV